MSTCRFAKRKSPSRAWPAALGAVLLLLSGLTPPAGLNAQAPLPKKKPEESPIPIFITPYYNSEGLQISVGEYSKKLAAADAKTILQVSKELKKARDKLRAEVMYVAAIRLYDLGQKDEAVYWFYTAQYRARVFSSILDPKKIGGLGAEAFELNHAYNAFLQLGGPYINRYAFRDLPKLEKTLATVVEEGKSLPKFADVYPKVAFSPSDSWAEKSQEIADGLNALIDHIQKNAETINKQLKENDDESK
jgi:hypothetical protein